MKRMDLLTTLMLAYGAASLLHFIHNAQFARDYPNFPDTITALQVYGVWLIVAATGLAGYLLMRLIASFVRHMKTTGVVGPATMRRP